MRHQITWIASTTVLLAIEVFLFFASGQFRTPAPLSIQPPEAHSAPVAAQPEPQYIGVADSRPACSIDAPLSLDNIETLNWTRCDSDLRPLWQKLRIPPGDFENASSLSRISSSFGDLDGDAVDERILHVRHTGVSRIVVLKKAQNTWTSMGFLDIPTFHLDPEARVVTNGRAHWLAVSGNEAAWGTGIFQQDEIWYASERGRLTQVLSFPAEGHLALGFIAPLDLRWETAVIPAPLQGPDDSIEVRYTLTLSTWVGSRATAGFSQAVFFTRSPSALRFEFDSEQSRMSKDEFLSVYDVWKFDWPQFLKAAREELRSLATAGATSRQSIVDLLAVCRETVQDAADCDELTQALEQ